MHIHPRARRARSRVAATGGALALLGGFVAIGGPPGSSASSHREAPLIAGDPRADNTDLYAFVSPDAPDTVTMIANWIPFEEPNGGPNFYPWADDTRYNIKIDNDGDALPDLTYTWVFDTVIRNPATFLYNTGPVSTITDPDLNYYQTYDLTVTAEGGPPVALLGDGDGVHDPTDPIAAPSLSGPGSIPDYAPLVTGATYPLPGGGQSYAGQADDPFFLDLRVFDLLYGGDLSEVGQDTLAGYNVNSIAIQLPKTALAGAGSPTDNPVIGIWSTTDRRSARTANGEGNPASAFVQVSRLGNPLVNEVVFPLALKDAFNSISPDVDATIPAAVDAVTNPILPPLIEAIYGVPAPDGPRNDLEEIFLQGVSAANAGLGGDPATVLPVDLNGHDLNADHGALQPSEQLRLNMSIAPSATPNRLSLFAGQFDGFPNGRRLVDDVVDVAIQTVMGAAQSGTIVQALAAGDAVNRNDREFRSSFPYLALPHADGVNLGTERSPRASDFVSVVPERVLDTRSSTGQIGYIGTKPAAGQVVEVKVTGTGASLIPDDAASVVVHVTATEAEAPSFVTVYDCDGPRPNASNVNATADAGTAWSNLATAGISADGTICLYTLASSHLIVDVNGYMPSTSTITATAPERLLETRATFGQKGYSGAKPAAGSTIELDVTQVGANQVAADAEAVFVNVTAVNADGAGFVTVWDCDVARPTSSALNYEQGSSLPNLMVAPIGDDGTICLFTLASTDLLVDVLGQVPAGSQYVPAGPQRILETREEIGQIGYAGTQPAGGQVIEVQVTGVGAAAVPSTATSVFLNVTTTNESPVGYFTVWPCGQAQPTASSGNYRGVGKSTANAVVASIGDSGRVCIYVLQPVDLVVDLVGYFPGVTAS
jgi:Domain of unknown function (DUF4331)